MTVDGAIAYAHEHHDDFLSDLQELLRIPSVSTLPEHAADMRRAAKWLCDRVSAIGLEAEVISGAGHPIVDGEWLGAGDAATILIYGHYDVQPADPLELWMTPPFEPTNRDGNIYARGACDDKGQTMVLIDAVQSLLQATGRLPVNVKFLIEGEEECGGETVTAFVRANPERVSADVALVADTHMFGPGIPTLDTGLRGNVYAEIFARGAAHDLHSGAYGGVAPNPLNALAHIIAGLKDLNGTVTIPGFYDRLRMPDENVLESWRSLPFDEDAFLRDEVGSTALTGEAGYSPLERMWARPTLDVHGIPGGFIGKGGKTVIPARASAKVSMRLVPDQRTDEIEEMFVQRVKELRPPGIEVEVEVHRGSDAVVVPTESPFIQAACAALEETFGHETILARSGGSIPIVGLFKQVLGLDSVLMGFGLPDDNLHAPNEKFSLDNFYHGIEAVIRFLQGASELAR